LFFSYIIDIYNFQVGNIISVFIGVIYFDYLTNWITSNW